SLSRRRPCRTGLAESWRKGAESTVRGVSAAPRFFRARDPRHSGWHTQVPQGAPHPSSGGDGAAMYPRADRRRGALARLWRGWPPLHEDMPDEGDRLLAMLVASAHAEGDEPPA